MRLVFLGLSLSSSWGNGHATTYRALLRALHRRGHDILFLEREQPWYAEHRDLSAPGFCALRFYDRLADLDRYERAIARADAVIVGSYVPDGSAVIRRLVPYVRRLFCFYDIDTPITIRSLACGGATYLRPEQVSLFDLYLSFTGGPALGVLKRNYGARMARPLYCAVDTDLHRPVPAPRRWDLGYIGTYSVDRQPALERLLIAPARRLNGHRFVVAGPQYPPEIAWPANVERIEHLPPEAHSEFYSSLGWALSVTRADMVTAGWSPSVRLFEASACGVPIISDPWPGISSFFRPDSEILIASSAADVEKALRLPEDVRVAIGAAGQTRAREQHSADLRAQELEAHLQDRRCGVLYHGCHTSIRAPEGAVA